ncbi:hypothetical protein [Citreimonas salinaria]|nr:hypothetical protein [Citreimonas salinaria]
MANLTHGNGKRSLAGTQRHAKRQDEVSRKRSIGDPLQNYAWSKAGLGMANGGCDIIRAHQIHLEQTGAGQRANSAPAMHLLAVVSPAWLLETGDPRETSNPRVKDLILEAQLWAEDWCGPGSVFHVRYDTDERGAGVVDILVAPVRMQRHKTGAERPTISGRKAREELLAQERAFDPAATTATAAMQSSWARWCQAHLDPRIERGTPKRLTRREHVHAEVYGQIRDEVREELRASLRAEVREELARSEVEAAHKLAQAAIERLNEEVARHKAKVASARSRFYRARATSQARLRMFSRQLKKLEEGRASMEAEQAALRRAREGSDPHLDHLRSLIKAFEAASPADRAHGTRQAIAGSLAIHKDLERLVLGKKHPTFDALMDALEAAWRENPGNPNLHPGGRAASSLSRGAPHTRPGYP